jgi:aspartyl-tRNA(Asn)/glutamyl-tRNA(Gln) amidotransferase subunit A
MDFRSTTVAALAADVAAKKVSSRELVQGALDRIGEVNPEVNAFVVVDGDAALREASALDDRIAKGEAVGALAGIPIGVKDLEDAAGFPTSLGSALYADRPSVEVDSPFVARLRAAGCVVIGKTNTPEMGWKGDTTNPRWGATANPWDLTRSAGGSSGGSAAALASGMVPLCTGSDGGGSIRIPAAICGLSGMKPSLGRVPTGDVTPPGWADLSTRGPMARTIRDITLALDCVVGPDPHDLRSLPMPDVSWSRSLDAVKPPLRIAWSPTLGYAKVDAEVQAICERALRKLSDLGSEIVPVDPVFDEDPVRSWLSMTMAGDLRMIEHLRGTPDWDQLDPDHLRMIESFGVRVTAVELLGANDECHRLNLKLVDLFHRAQVLCTPTVGGQVGPIGEYGTIDGEPDPFWISFTYPFNMTRSPAGTVCAGFTQSGLPVGLQVIGPQHGDVAVLRTITAVEDAMALDRLAPI